MIRTLAIVACALSQLATAKVVKYTTVTGYFQQDLNSTDPATFDYTAQNFGLLNQSYPHKGCLAPGLSQWQLFAGEVDRLNSEAAENVEYRVLFLGRHGEGWHNAAESYYGTPAWNCYWSLVNGNETAYWEDPKLTPGGIEQAVIANRYWARLIAEQRITTPQSYYVSPLQRCLATAEITFEGLDLPASKPFVPTVKEFLREGVSIHTCDHRSNKTYIQSQYPNFKIEDGFAEFDPYWNGITREPSNSQDLRSKSLLDDVFLNDESKWISMTAHSGEITSILRVIGHRAFRLSTGAIIPVLVKAEFSDEEPTPTSATWPYDPHCTAPPQTSNAAEGCVCVPPETVITDALVTLPPTNAPVLTWTPPAPLQTA